MDVPELMTSAEVAEALRTTIKNVQKMARGGKIPYTIIGGRIKFLKEDINNIIYSNYRRI